MRERIETAIKQTGEVYVTSQGRRETWESVAAMQEELQSKVAQAMEQGVILNQGRSEEEVLSGGQ